jgi:hypothetical protein
MDRRAGKRYGVASITKPPAHTGIGRNQVASTCFGGEETKTLRTENLLDRFLGSRAGPQHGGCVGGGWSATWWIALAIYLRG